MLRSARAVAIRSRGRLLQPKALRFLGASRDQAAKAPIHFDDHETIYKDRSSAELARALVILGSCRLKFLVNNAKELMGWSNATIGKGMTNWLIKKTFFSHFCAGETEEDIAPTTRRLMESNVGSILDYAAEAALEEEKPASEAADAPHAVARTYPYSSEAVCDANMRTTLCAIRAAASDAKQSGAAGFAAVKVTSLGRPELLQHVSQVLVENRAAIRRIFEEREQLVGVNPLGGHDHSSSSPSDGGTHASLRTVLSQSRVSWYQDPTDASAGPLEAGMELPFLGVGISREEFAQLVRGGPGGAAPGGVSFGQQLSDDHLDELFDRMDTSGDGKVDYLEWMSQVDASTLAQAEVRSPVASIIAPHASHYLQRFWQAGQTKLESSHLVELDSMFRRADELAAAAKDAGVTLMFDAEQTFLQPAIDHVVEDLMARYNTLDVVTDASELDASHSDESAFVIPNTQHRFTLSVFNTYQMYLKDSLLRLRLGIHRARRAHAGFGAKLVRGAYLMQERARSAAGGYVDPIHATLNDTHDSYDAGVAMVLHEAAEGGATQVMAATHNERSVLKAVALAEQLGIAPDSGRLHFGQLLGMCDHITLTLGKEGYSAYKYVPYGPVDEVMPYLIRRAEENSDMLGSAAREMDLMGRELRRRAFG